MTSPGSVVKPSPTRVIFEVLVETQSKRTDRAEAQDRAVNQRSDMRDHMCRQKKKPRMRLFSTAGGEEVLNLLESWTLESLIKAMSLTPENVQLHIYTERSFQRNYTSSEARL